MSAPTQLVPPLVLDGTTYEGGGGLIRYAIAYSSILNQPIHIHTIRANRPGVGGLRPEHTVAISTMAELTSAAVTGNTPASREMTFTPHAMPMAVRKPLPAELDVTVEGSASIFLIAMLPYLLFSNLAAEANGFQSSLDREVGLRLIIRAGTLCVKAPSIMYLRQVLMPTLELIGIGGKHLRLEPEDEQGWHTENNKYPGKMAAWVKPLSKPLSAFVLAQRGELRSIRVTAHAPRHATQRFEEILRAEMADAIREEASEVEITIDISVSDPDDQYHLLMAATTEAPRAYLGYEQTYPQSDVFSREIAGDVDKIALLLARSCIRGLWDELRRGNAVDEHTEDILILYQSLASGFSSVAAENNERPVPEMNSEFIAIKPGSEEYEIDTGSMHRQTSWWVASKMTGVREETFSLQGRECRGSHGIGLGT